MGKRMSLPASSAMVPIARHGVAALLSGFGRLADVELIVTELVTSAVRSSGADFTITVEHGVEVRIEVHDRRGQHPRDDDSDSDSDIDIDPETPDGLAIVSAVADRFGSRRHHQGDRTSWAVLSP